MPKNWRGVSAPKFFCLHVDQALPPVMVSPEIGPVMDVGAMTRIAEEQRMMAQKELDKIVNRMRDSGLKARSMLKVGSPFLEDHSCCANQGADLIVMGTHGRTGIAHVLMGSVAERVVQKAHCPVLTIRHPIASSSTRWTSSDHGKILRSVNRCRRFANTRLPGKRERANRLSAICP